MASSARMKRTVPDALGSIVCLMLLNAVRPAAAACVTPTAVCAEYFHVRNRPARVLIYRSHSLAIPDREITHAIIAIHGAERDAATSFRLAAAAPVLSGRPESALGLAPRFATGIGPACADDVGVGEVHWPCDAPCRD